MSFLDKAKGLLDQHDDTVDGALNKGGDAAKGRFAGHEGHIDAATDRAQEMTGAGDRTRVPPADADPSVPPVDSQPADEQQFEPDPAHTDPASNAVQEVPRSVPQQ